jgi:hypothetical protein
MGRVDEGYGQGYVGIPKIGFSIRKGGNFSTCTGITPGNGGTMAILP